MKKLGPNDTFESWDSWSRFPQKKESWDQLIIASQEHI